MYLIQFTVKIIKTSKVKTCAQIRKKVRKNFGQQVFSFVKYIPLNLFFKICHKTDRVFIFSQSNTLNYLQISKLLQNNI